MSRKYDFPFVEMTFWCPIREDLWQLLKEHPSFQAALCDVLLNLSKKQEGGNT